jgi:hypothetical protein
VPKSPAEFSAGGVNLCLAAAVAKAGFLLSGLGERAEDLAEQLARTKSKDLLRSAFAELGWSERDCDMRLGLNDAAAEVTRKREVLAYLHQSGAGQ